jgi:7-cyano-7-deazaguanine synthase in queuosine biosynthesis
MILPSNPNNALVLWSGGADSTCLLHEMLRRDYNVRALTVIHPQVAAVKEQRAARANLKARFRRMGYAFKSLEVTVGHGTGKGGPPDFAAEPTGEDGGVIQPVVWLTAAVAYLLRDEDLYLGYIKSDCAIHYLPQLRLAFDQLKAVAGRKGNLVVPMEWVSKAQVLNLLDAHKLTPLVWYCERPVRGKPCKKCSPCMTHATGRWQLKSGNALYV